MLPPVVALLPLPYTLGDDPLAGAEQPNHLGRTGEDFYALRPYVVGDDLRRVHWPSTARTGELLVRQDEQPWQGRVTVLLDVRRTTTDQAGFERMVTAAASVIAASGRRGDLVRLVTTGGIDTGAMSGHAQLEALMEHLAGRRAHAVGGARPDPRLAGRRHRLAHRRRRRRAAGRHGLDRRRAAPVGRDHDPAPARPPRAAARRGARRSSRRLGRDPHGAGAQGRGAAPARGTTRSAANGIGRRAAVVLSR